MAKSRWYQRLDNWYRRKANPFPPKDTVELVGGGFRIAQDNGVLIRDVGWDDVAKVYAYKLDMGTWDDAVLCFELLDKHRIEVWESWLGFGALLEATVARTGWQGDWFNDVVMPPFATNFSLLWSANCGQPRPVSDCDGRDN